MEYQTKIEIIPITNMYEEYDLSKKLIGGCLVDGSEMRTWGKIDKSDVFCSLLQQMLMRQGQDSPTLTIYCILFIMHYVSWTLDYMNTIVWKIDFTIASSLLRLNDLYWTKC